MSGRIAPAAAAAALAFAVATAEPPALEFHRVHVPAGRLGDVPLGGDRYVPMPLVDFDAAVARARAAAGAANATEPQAPVTSARWRATLDESGGLTGTVSCTIDEAAAGPGRVLPLGGLRVRRAIVAGDPPREATICGVGAGLALAIPQAGTYEMEFRCAAGADDAASFRVPLVPALSTTLELDLPTGLRPVLTGSAARRAVVAPPASEVGPWRIEVGPAAELGIGIESRDRPAPPVAVWSEVVLAPPGASLAATVVPAAPWRQGRLELDQDAALRVTDVRAAGDDEPLDHVSSADGRSLAVVVPRWLEGRRTPLEIRGVAPATGSVWRLPLVRAASATVWSGGGAIVTVDPAFAIRGVEFEECRVVTPETAAAWPLPRRIAAAAAAYHVEQQGPGAKLAVTIGPRTTSFDVARVTTVEITPNAVLGRAACDVRVTGGEAFEITGLVAPGWIIDAVDAVDWSARDDGDVAARGVTATDPGVDWRIVPSPVGDTLRIGLAFAADRERGIGLRITGHRAGLAPGAAFTTADIDMVRLEGEAAEAAVIDLRTGADAFVEIAGRPAGWFDVEGRLAPLVEEGKARGRIRGGERAPAVEARVVRRRPPLDVSVNVNLEPRDDALVQTYTFDCRSEVGVESLVVDFAAPGGDGLAWRVESPAGVAATARPLEPSEGGLASRSDAIAASWLVELSPPPSGPVVIRASRTVPFTDAVPVPLAWVEGALENGGTVVVAAAAGARPRLVNRRLRELPADPGPDGTAAEFAYGGPLPGAAAELVPVAPGSDARAWAWRETVSCWCDESGATETESRFDVENEGRPAVALSLAPGRRLEAVIVGGVAVSGVEFGPAGGTWQIPLPPARRRVDIVVRTLAVGRPGRGAWRVDPSACGLDVPVLDRDVRLLLPPELLIVATGGDAHVGVAMPWAARLFGVGGSAAPAADASSRTGYRSESVSGGRDRGAGLFVVRRGLLSGGAILAALLAGVCCFFWGRHGAVAGTLPAAAAGFAALWVPDAFVPVARAAWWGGLAGLALAVWRAPPRLPRFPLPWRSAAASAGAAVAILMSHAAPAADGGLRVFVTPGATGETALVPEPLFRALAAFATPQSAAIRTLECRIDAGQPEWRLALDIDADAGGMLLLDAGPGATWLPPSPGAGVVVAGREARITAVVAGRSTIELGLAPAVERRGPIETLTASIPLAPAATLRVGAGDVVAGTLACERADGAGPFTAAPSVAGGGGFDVSAAGRVRLVRPVDPGDRLAVAIRAADSVNDVSWERDGCRVDATIEIDAGSDLVRSFAVRVDPRVEGIAAVGGDAAPRLEPLGGGRVAVVLPDAVRGRTRVRLTGRLPLADPVGACEVPGIWLDGVAGETRTVELAADAEFDALLDPPPPAAATAADLAGRPPVRALVRRRRSPVRGTQGLAVSFAPAGLRLTLEAQIDAATTALARIPIDVPVGSAVDRVTLLIDDPADAGGREPVDIEWSRVAADRVVALVQRPRAGRFRLEVDARLERKPASRGRLPLVRARLGFAAPLLVSWTAEPPLAVTVEGGGDAVRPDVIELPEGASEPDYTLTMSADVLEPTPRPAPPDEHGEAASRVEWAEVRAAFDGRGRVHGLARFDVIAQTPTVRLRLPPGMRLFDVLVDGRVAAIQPHAADAWDVSLGAVAWPRTILAVFAGDIGGEPVDGRPLALAAPRLEGLPETEVFWELSPPAGSTLTVAPPARLLAAAAAAPPVRAFVGGGAPRGAPPRGGPPRPRLLDAAAAATTRSAAAERIATACGRIAAGVPGLEGERLEALATLRRQALGPAAEESWLRATDRRAGAASVNAIAVEPLVIRVVAVRDPTMHGRALATVVLVATAGLAWTVSARRRAARARG